MRAGGVIDVVASTGSTNADLLAAARSGAPEGRWLRAERQERGRGRLERPWESPPGNLYASTIVRLRTGDPPAPSLALVAGVALAEVAGAYAGPGRLTVKWPNDLLAGPAKLAGILLERDGDAIVIGFGVNLTSHPALPDRPTADLAALVGHAPGPHEFCGELAIALARWLARWRGEGLEPVRRRWLEQAHPPGSAISVGPPHARVEGLFDGLERDGSLRLRRADGTIEIVRAGDVQLL